MPAQPKTDLRPFYGVGKTLFSINPGVYYGDTAAWNEVLELTKTAGFDFWRNEISWAETEKNGQYDFAYNDQAINSVLAKGMGNIVLLAYGHPDYFSGAKKSSGWDPLVPRTAAEIDAFSRWAIAAIKRYDVATNVFEIWNEPDEPMFWSAPGPNASEYSNLLKTVLEKAHVEQPKARLTTGGLLGGFNAIWMNDVNNTGADQLAAAIGVHPYRALKPETLATDYTRTRLDFDGRGDTRPFWDTEWGYASDSAFIAQDGKYKSDATLKRQAVMQARRMLAPYLLGFEHTALFKFRDSPGEGNPAAEGKFGLYDEQLKPKPSYAAVKKILMTLKTNKYAGMVTNTPIGLHIVKMEGTSAITYIVWNDRVEQSYELKLENIPLATHDMLGNTIETKKIYQVAESDGPIYLTFLKQ